MNKFIVFEGLDGSGKGTQAKRLCEYLESKNTPYKKLDFPDYESESSALVKMYLRGEFGSDAYATNPYAASSFYAVDRYAGFVKHWKNDIENGKIIISDRYTTSNAVHQTCKLKKEKWDEYLNWLYDYEFDKLKLPKPDLVLYFDMKPEISQELINKRYKGDNTKKDIHECNLEYLKNSREAALYAAKKLDWTIIKCYENDSPLTPDDIFERVLSITISS